MKTLENWGNFFYIKIKELLQTVEFLEKYEKKCQDLVILQKYWNIYQASSVNGISDSTYFCDVMSAELFFENMKMKKGF